MRVCVTLVLAAAVVAAPAAAQPPRGGNPADEAAILKNAEAFVASFEKADAKALAAHWTAQGDYTDQAGKTISGREAIEKSFTEFFGENKGLKLRIDITGLRFITADVAVEDGMTSVINPDGTPPSRARYTIVHVKKDGKWLLDSVREAPYTPPSNYEHLKALEWAIGDWADDVKEGETARISFEWTDNQNFIVSHFTTTIKNVSIGGGTSWIGWDPNAKTIRGWMFESSGGFGESTWTKDGKTWTIKSSAVLPDGKKVSATNVVTRIDADTITWEVKDRTLDGKPQPDIKPVRMKKAN